MKTVIVRGVYIVSIDQLTEYSCLLDTGYNREETIKILKRMYKNADWDTQKIDVVLLEEIESEEVEKHIRFSYNWNNKLNCKAFTTIRLHSPERYFLGAKFNVYLNGKPI